MSRVDLRCLPKSTEDFMVMLGHVSTQSEK